MTYLTSTQRKALLSSAAPAPLLSSLLGYSLNITHSYILSLPSTSTFLRNIYHGKFLISNERREWPLVSLMGAVMDSRCLKYVRTIDGHSD